MSFDELCCTKKLSVQFNFGPYQSSITSALYEAQTELHWLS
jgi:hypothetical protein